jgi:hypothetical protein
MEFGNLMSYGPDLEGLFRHSTKYVDKIVGGTNPSRPSGGAPDKISSHFNHKTAMTLHLTILNQGWAAFTRFIDDGRVCLTNNTAERALRGVAVGRKNWTFAGPPTKSPNCSPGIGRRTSSTRPPLPPE